LPGDETLVSGRGDTVRNGIGDWLDYVQGVVGDRTKGADAVGAGQRYVSSPLGEARVTHCPRQGSRVRQRHIRRVHTGVLGSLEALIDKMLARISRRVCQLAGGRGDVDLGILGRTTVRTVRRCLLLVIYLAESIVTRYLTFVSA
jgi:hypothetical protein